MKQVDVVPSSFKIGLSQVRNQRRVLLFGQICFCFVRIKEHSGTG